MTLQELLKDSDSVSFIGMCKNAGKTTALNRMIRELHEAGVPVSLTSVGRDGESSDLVTNTVKPGIYVFRGTLVATASDLLKYCDVTREILYTTGIFTPMGEVVVLRAQSDGFVQIAGPSMTSQMRGVTELFRREQQGKILIDGALERKSIAVKDVSDSTILCTGASYHKDMRRVIRDTAYACRLLTLPGSGIKVPHSLREQTAEKYIPFDEQGEPDTGKAGKKITDIWNRRRPLAEEQMKNGQTKTVLVRGGLTDGMIRPLLTSGADLRGKHMVFQDGSRILLSVEMYEKLQQRGLQFEVVDPIHLLAVTVNPFSAYGFHFDAEEFYRKMSEAVDVPVFDVRRKACR